jgi:Tol biopolymer transport system component
MKAIVTAILAAALAASAQTGEAARQLKAARNAELVDGDLNAAIKQYAAIVSKYVKTDRAATAMALVHMAECHQKLGSAESRKLYEQVVREYADQKEAVAIARARLGGVAQPARQTSTLLWSSPNVDPQASVSFDGRYIAYPDWDTGDLGLHDIATGTDRGLVNKGTWKDSSSYAEQSAISRDNKLIAYAWFNQETKRYELWLANLSGDAKPRRLFDNTDSEWIAPFDWSPDGKWVAMHLVRKDRSSQIALVSVPEGQLRVLKSTDWRGPTRMFFSPDGKYLAYDMPENETSRQRDVFVLAVDGTREIPAVAGQGDEAVMGWSPDGKWLLFAKNRTESTGLWGLRFADGKPQGAPEMMKADIANAAALGVTHSGALLYAMITAPRQTTIRIASFDFAGGRFLSAPKEVPQEYFINESRSPAWSRDGKYLSHLSRQGRRGIVLIIRSADTGQLIRELPVKLNYFGPTDWMPDGRSIVAWGTDFKGRNGIYQIDVQTGEASLVQTTGETSQPMPMLSPDGKRLYYRLRSEDRKEWRFIERDLVSGAEKELIRRPDLGAATPSPDGRYLVTYSADPTTKRQHVLLIPLDSGEPRVALRADGDDQRLSGFTWAPDSRSFLTWKQFANQEQEIESWQVPIDGTPRKLDLQLGGLFAASVAYPARFWVHPDEKRVAFVFSERPPKPPASELWMLEKFLPPNK